MQKKSDYVFCILYSEYLKNQISCGLAETKEKWDKKESTKNNQKKYDKF